MLKKVILFKSNGGLVPTAATPGLQSIVVVDYACSSSFNIYQRYYYL